MTAPARAGGFPFDHRDTMVLKGIAILAIVLHNYLHMLWGAVGENEFDFEPDHPRSFISAVGEPTRLIQAFFSYSATTASCCSSSSPPTASRSHTGGP